MVITLLTDFGLDDAYVAMMKGVILGIAPDVRLVDITHHIPPQDVYQAALTLHRSHCFFPEGTIHVAVVDPGVGSDRAILGVDTGRYRFLAPDNGLLHPMLEDHRDALVYRIVNPKYFLKHISRTFHGRDIFAPAAAYLASSIPLSEMGDPVDSWMPLDIPQPIVEKETITGEITGFDHFGNAITNIGSGLLEGEVEEIRVGKLKLNGLSQAYTDVEQNVPLALVGSAGFLECSVRGGSMRQTHSLSIGDSVTVRMRP